MVNRLAVHDARKRELNAELKLIGDEARNIKEAAIAFAEKEGVDRLYGSDKQLTIKESIRVGYPKTGDDQRPAFEEVLKKQGIWDELSDFQWGALKKMAKKEGWLKNLPESLKPFVKMETVKSARLSRRKDVEE